MEAVSPELSFVHAMKSISEKYWKIPHSFILDNAEKEMAGQFSVEPQIIRLLFNRGYTEKETISRFLYPTLHDLEKPTTLKGVDDACSLIYSAVIDQRDIIIWGDYDVDGVTATSLLIRFFKMIGVEVRWFVPDRFSDGYGLNIDVLKSILEKYANKKPVLITVDCGIANHQEIAFAQSMNCQVVVTDHHQPGDEPVPADTIINPKQEGCNFGNKDIAGVGIAFYLAMSLRSYFKKKNFFNNNLAYPKIKNLLEFVAIGTIADMVPLRDGNRVLTKAGFEVINGSPSCGTAALLAQCDIHSGNITADDIAFQIAPKINAAGRLENADLAVQLFIEEDRQKAEKLARKLTLLNNRRKETCLQALETTLTYVDIETSLGTNCCILEVDYSIGILGILASQVAERIKKPVILVTEVEDRQFGKVLKGSARSVPGVDLYALLQRSERSLHRYGGHPMAAGVTLFKNDFAMFKKNFEDELEKVGRCEPKPRQIDLEIPVETAISSNITEQLQLLEPFGIGNEKPVFIENNVTIQDLRRIGKNGDHLKFTKRAKYENISCIGFGYGEYQHMLQNKPHCTMIFTISISRFRRSERWQPYLLDFL